MWLFKGPTVDPRSVSLSDSDHEDPRKENKKRRLKSPLEGFIDADQAV